MRLEQSLPNEGLARYLGRQLNSILPDESPVPDKHLLDLIEAAQSRVFRCFEGIQKKYFNEGHRVAFDHLHSDQYAMFLYMLANHISRTEGDPRLAAKLYYLNKVLHGVDIYFTSNLPEVFLFVHPLGTILGRAAFSDGLVVYQGCTVGCLNDGRFPSFAGPAILYAGSSVLGPGRVGRNVCVAAGVSVINTDVPDDVIVLGQYPDYEFRPNGRPTTSRPPFAYGPPY